MKHLRLVALFCLALTACGPSPEQLHATETAVASKILAQLTANAPTSTPTASSTTTKPPTQTRTSTPNYTPTPKPTKTPTSTPLPGSFSNPAPIGVIVTRVEEILKEKTLAVTVLEVRKGNDANKLAKSTLDWLTYETPIEGQEYIAIKAKMEVLKAPANEVYTLYTYWHLTLRYEEDGDDIWPVDVTAIIAKGYPPIKGEAWIFFLIRKGSQPFLYFQPDLIIDEQHGYRTSGAYFDLSQP